jgi:LPXTG-motif cell wall-anchored protein
VLEYAPGEPAGCTAGPKPSLAALGVLLLTGLGLWAVRRRRA